LLKLHEARLGKARVDRVMFPALTSAVLVMVLVLVFFATLFVSVLSMTLAHAHAMMLMWLDLLVLLG
jgi:hypothetical protein